MVFEISSGIAEQFDRVGGLMLYVYHGCRGICVMYESSHNLYNTYFSYILISGILKSGLR